MGISTLLPGQAEIAHMPNDAKFGLVVGLAVVITVSAVFYRKVGVPATTSTEEIKAAAVPSRKAGPSEGGQTVKARPAVREKTEAVPSIPSSEQKQDSYQSELP
jgi:hypothetical protein